MKKNVAVIGAGFSGLSAACYAAQKGYNVTVYEKHDVPGGRARQFETDNGFKFDMGPSWYWMPDVIDSFFTDMGFDRKAFYELVKLDPQFDIVFDQHVFSLPDNYTSTKLLFETYEKGSADQLDKYMDAAAYKYYNGMHKFVGKPNISWTEYIDAGAIVPFLKMDMFLNMRQYIGRFFKDPYLRIAMEFPVIFLGSKPNKIPAMYSLMNYGGYKLGTWYPMGGFVKIIDAMYQVALKMGVKFEWNADVSKINVQDKNVNSLTINGVEKHCDYLISSADYHFTETLLDTTYRNYNNSYWEKQILAPSCLIYYIGLNKKIDKLKHHTLFFEYDLDYHLSQVYDQPQWPDKPLFYVCCPSKTDAEVAPEGCENLFVLVPISPGLSADTLDKEAYLDALLKRIEQHSGATDLKSAIIYQRSYAVEDFVADYNAFKGNAYGLANTLNQSAIFKPKIINKQLKNMFYTGQLTVPGPGVPPAIISGKIASSLLPS